MICRATNIYNSFLLRHLPKLPILFIQKISNCYIYFIQFYIIIILLKTKKINVQCTSYSEFEFRELVSSCFFKSFDPP